MPPVSLVAGLAAVGVLVVAADARAEPSACGDRAKLVDKLAERYAEVPVSRGLTRHGAVLEVFASPNGSFTVILTRPDGVSCLVATGEAWHEIPIQDVENKA